VIHQFDFDEQTGKLTQNETPWVLGQKGFGPRHYAYHPTLDMIYFDNEQGCSVTAYALDRSTGTVEAMQTVSTLPDNYKDDNSCAQIHIAPSGNYVYASNRGHNSIAVFAIGPTTGMLTAVAQEPTVAIPRAFNIDPSGKFMLVGSLESGEIATYRIDSESGRLGHVETQKVGVEPMWIHITEPVG
jgi:6-phosphogluconolactonase